MVAYVSGHVLLHGVFDPLAAHQEDGAFTDIHAVVRDALQIVDYKAARILHSGVPPLLSEGLAMRFMASE